MPLSKNQSISDSSKASSHEPNPFNFFFKTKPTVLPLLLFPLTVVLCYGIIKELIVFSSMYDKKELESFYQPGLFRFANRNSREAHLVLKSSNVCRFIYKSYVP